MIDTGRGVSPVFRAAVFGEFVREGDSAKGPPVEGTGLGLTISRRLAEALGGWLSLEDNEGQGTVATLVLPLRPPGAERRRSSGNEDGLDAEGCSTRAVE